MLYVTHESSFVSTQFFIFNLDRWLSDNISYYHIIFRSSVVSFLFLVDIYLPLDIYLSNPIFSASVSIVYKLFCGGVLETYVIMSAILLPIKSPVTSAVFFNFSFWSSFSCFCYRLFSLIKKKIHTLLQIFSLGWTKKRVIFMFYTWFDNHSNVYLIFYL